MEVKHHIAIVVLLLSNISLVAQNAMRIHYKSGTEQDIPISEIDSVTFVNKATSEEDMSLTVSWLWGAKDAGYYELLTFDDDHTYIGYDNYFMYGFETMTYGWYSLYGNMLNLQSNGFGYQKRYNWFVLGLTGNALEVMAKMGGFIYYKLQPETLHLSVSEDYSGLAENDSVFFADGVVVKVVGNKLHGLIHGITYVLVRKESEDKIYAYKVDVK